MSSRTHHRLIGPADLRTLRARLTRAGAFARHERATYGRVAALLLAFAGLCALQLVVPIGWAVALIPLQALCVSTVAMHGHEGGHGSLSDDPRSNALLLHLCFPLLGGVSALHWKHKHNAGHHGHPNVVTAGGGDPDLHLWPLACSREDHAAAGPVLRGFQRHLQGAAFWPLCAFLTFAMRFDGMALQWSRYRRQGMDRVLAVDLACQVGHYGLWIVLPGLAFGFAPVVGVYLGIWGLVGLILAAIFLPAHVGLPMVNEVQDTWLLQLQTTRNLRIPRWLNPWFVGLQYQVEHHLFPRIPYQNLPLAAPIVRSWCLERGLPYQSEGYARAVAQATDRMANAVNQAVVSQASLDPRLRPHAALARVA